MIYPYKCTHCGHEFEIIKSVKHIDDTEYCGKCNAVADRYIAKSQFFYGASDWDNAHFNHGLGQEVKSNKEAEKIARERGMIPIGNESLESIHKHAKKEQERKEKSAYADINLNLGELRSVKSS